MATLKTPIELCGQKLGKTWDIALKTVRIHREDKINVNLTDLSVKVKDL